MVVASRFTSMNARGDVPAGSSLRTPSKGARVSLVVGMVVALVGVALVAYWGARRESAAALVDFGTDQARLAESVAAALRPRLVASVDEPDPGPRALAEIATLEHASSSVVLLMRHERGVWRRVDGSTIAAPEVDAAVASGASWARLSRPASASLGLPERTAMAGLATIEASASDRWHVAVVTTLQRERDRELRVQAILVLGVVVAGGLVLVFGGLALRIQRKELELAREVAVASAHRESDERLVRADKLATLGALATGIAHEVSTPLGVMVGRAEQLLPKVASDDRARRSVEAILEQGERISRVIRGFLSLARGASPAFEAAEPSTIARKAVELVEHRFDNAGVTLTLDVARALPPIACEPRLFEQALVNLLLNACDACARGRGEVHVQVRGDTERIAFVVTDNGVGIAPESAARVFEPFFTTKPDGEGTGLGLAIAHEIIKHHRATLTVVAREPSAGSSATGTRACIEIPAIERANDQVPAAE
jgi:two-component system NtrC family sensor kinase